MIRRPVYEYDAAKGPAIYRGRSWTRPAGSPIRMTIAEANALPEYMEIRSPQLFQKDSIQATIQPQYLERASIVILRILKDEYPARPMYFARTTGNYAQTLGLESYMMTQGLARKLMPQVPKASRDTILTSEGWVDLRTSLALWDQDFLGPRAVIRRGLWVDRASVGIPYIYIATAISLSQITASRGDSAEAAKFALTARQIASATGLDEMFGPAPRGGKER